MSANTSQDIVTNDEVKNDDVQASVTDNMEGCKEHEENGDKDMKNGDGREKDEAIHSNGDTPDLADLPRQVVVRNIDKKATSDDLEDFFYDNYENVETICRETFTSGTGDNQKELFKGSVVLTFTDEQSSKKFLEKKVRYKKWKLETVSRKQFLQRKKDNVKKKEDGKEKRNNDMSKADECTVVCTGFHKKASTLQEVMNYMYDNHENIIDVNMEIHRDARGFEKWETETTIIFADKKTAERFLNLSYVKFKGVYITRTSLQDHKLKKTNAKRKKAEKKYEDVLVEGSSLTLRGFDTEKEMFGAGEYRATREQIKEKLVSNLKVGSDDICYISFKPGDTEAIIRMKSAVAKDLTNSWNEGDIEIGGDKIKAELLAGEAEQTYLGKCKEEIVQKMERKNTWNAGKKMKGSKFHQNGNSRTNWLEDY